MTMILFCSFILGLSYRIRGGWLKIGSTTLGRVQFSILYGALCALYFEDWALLATAPAIFAGIVFGWGEVFKVENWKQFFGMCGRGVVVTTPPAIAFYYLLDPETAWLYALWGAGIGVLYGVCRLIKPKIGYTVVAEFLTGAYLALGWLVL